MTPLPRPTNVTQADREMLHRAPVRELYAVVAFPTAQLSEKAIEFRRLAVSELRYRNWQLMYQRGLW